MMTVIKSEVLFLGKPKLEISEVGTMKLNETMDASQFDRALLNEHVEEGVGERSSAVNVVCVEGSQLSKSENKVIICGIKEGIELGSPRGRKDNKRLGRNRTFGLVFEDEKIG